MDVSCVWFCHSQLRCATGMALIVMICLGTLTLLIQSLYLHSSLGESLMMVLPARVDQLGLVASNAHKSEVNFSYHMFGRPQVMIRFRPIQNKFEFTTHDTETKFNIFKHPKLFDSSFNGNMTIHHLNPLGYHKASNNNMYIMSAFDRSSFFPPSYKLSNSVMTGNITSKNGILSDLYNRVVVTGWLAIEKVNRSMLCCLLKDDKTVIQYTNVKRIVWTQVKKQALMAVKITCPLPGNVSRQELIGATVVGPKEHCNKKTFIEIENAKKAPNGSIALCSKIVYGPLSGQRLIEWLEIQRYIGVDKVLIYVYNLNTEAMSVLKHYAEDGLVDIIPYDIPKPEIRRHVGQKAAQPFIDEQVVVFDCMERLRGYTYVGVMDVDEVMYSRISPKHNLKHLMERLHRRSPKAAGFSFKTELFITEWPTENLTSTEKLFWHSSHQNRTRPIMDRVKNLLMVDRVVMASVWTHNFTTKPGFGRYTVPASVATLQHYRPCRMNWHCHLRRGYKDRGISSIVTTIKDKLLKMFEVLNVTMNST